MLGICYTAIRTGTIIAGGHPVCQEIWPFGIPKLLYFIHHFEPVLVMWCLDIFATHIDSSVSATESQNSKLGLGTNLSSVNGLTQAKIRAIDQKSSLGKNHWLQLFVCGSPDKVPASPQFYQREILPSREKERPHF